MARCSTSSRRRSAALAPERTFHVGGLSKSVAAGVRGGWVACPPHLAPRVQIAHKMVTGGLPFLLAELSARWCCPARPTTSARSARDEIEAREAIARRDLRRPRLPVAHKRAPFLWLKLPEPWLSGTFKQAAGDRRRARRRRGRVQGRPHRADLPPHPHRLFDADAPRGRRASASPPSAGCSTTAVPATTATAEL